MSLKFKKSQELTLDELNHSKNTLFNAEKPFEFLLTNELLKTLACAYGDNWNKEFSLEDMKTTISNALKLLESYEDQIRMSRFFINRKTVYVKGLSDRQINMALDIKRLVRERDLCNAYRQLWDCIDDCNRGMQANTYITIEEYMLYNLLLNNLFYSLN
jgi:hypothetical protein